jgi:hypothetical protein
MYIHAGLAYLFESGWTGLFSSDAKADRRATPNVMRGQEAVVQRT